MKFVSTVLNWYFSRKVLPYWCVFSLDCMIVLLAYVVGLYVEDGREGALLNLHAKAIGLVICEVMFALSFLAFRTYRGVIRFSSFFDLQRVLLATVSGTLMVYGMSWLVDPVDAIEMPGGIAMLSMFLVVTLLMWFMRIVVKRMFETLRTDDVIPVAIYGTKSGGVSLANSIMSQRQKEYELAAFISDGTEMKDSTLFGKKVYLNTNGIAWQMKERGVKALLVSPLKSELFRNNQEMIDEFLHAGIKLMMMPAVEEWDGTSVLTTQSLKEVDIEDLLPRDKIEVDLKAIGEQLKDKVILITGAAGSIGSEMVRQVAVFKPSKMILVDQAETPMHDLRLMMARKYAGVENETIVGSIANKELMEQLFAKYRPEYVFHAAAYKHVPMMEDIPGVAVQNNIYGTRVVADLAVKYGTKKFVMISTDKAVNPTNVMGCSKRICEIYCQSLNKAIVEGKVEGVTQFVTTRFGNVLGSNGSVIPIFKEQIRKGGPITVTHPDIIRYFMLIPEACKLVLEAGTMGKGGEIFVFDMGKPVKIVDLAKLMIRLSGAKNVEIKFTGLRDGEKLYEEVLNDEEQTKPTHHPKIMIASVREYDYETAKENENRLMAEAMTFDDMKIVKVMKEIVPEYKSRCSRFEVLDK